MRNMNYLCTNNMFFQHYCHNCDFETITIMLEKHIICMINDSNEKYELSLYKKHGQCYSGWTTATWGIIGFVKVQYFGAITHYPKYPDNNKIVIDMEKVNKKGIYKCDYFSYSKYGGDNYYPNGYANVNLEMFEKTNRGFDKNPVWLFQGDNIFGPTYLANLLKNNMNVVEMDQRFEIENSNSNPVESLWDQFDELPENIVADIIILGNKYTMDQIKNLISGKIISVVFSGNNNIDIHK